MAHSLQKRCSELRNVCSGRADVKCGMDPGTLNPSTRNVGVECRAGAKHLRFVPHHDVIESTKL